MFDEIFKRWIETGQLTINDVAPLFLEWDQEFGNGMATPELVFFMLSTLHTDYTRMMNYILKMIGIKRGYHWEEIRDINGIVIKRFFVND